MFAGRFLSLQTLILASSRTPLALFLPVEFLLSVRVTRAPGVRCYPSYKDSDRGPGAGVQATPECRPITFRLWDL